MKKTMKKTIKETRELMDNVNEFLSEAKSASEQAAEEFKTAYAQQLASKLGPQWQSKGTDWSQNSNIEQIIHDFVYQFVTDNHPEQMGDEERSEAFVQSVMQYI